MCRMFAERGECCEPKHREATPRHEFAVEYREATAGLNGDLAWALLAV